ncbi:MAG: TrkH family potassium uptake protein, partial [Candidatus Zixiibacteriota bacterium]
MNIRYIAKLIGLLLLVMSVAMMTSLIWAFIDHDGGAVRSFVFSVSITSIVGATMIFIGRNSRGDLYV